MTNCQPIRVHPDAPHYLEYRGRPIILITSAEHYGAVINGEFDLVTYLDALAAFEMNYTRIYPGAYFETEGFFGCEGNTLGPRAGRHVLPWARSGTGEYSLGGSLFDLDTWDPQYFERLRTFARLAADRDIIVEICFYNVMYPQVWDFMPMNAKNNIQGVGECDFSRVQSVANTDLLPYQVEYVRKIVLELNEFDNIIFEIIDEPGNYGVSPEEYSGWISQMIDVVRGAEAGRSKRHLVAQQVLGTIGGAGDFSLDPRVDIATGQYVQRINGGQLGGMRLLDSIYHHGKPIEFNESTWFPGNYNQSGPDADPGPDPISGYRAEAWEFVIGGGAAYNHLNALYTAENPGARDTGNDEVLTYLQNLRRFMNGFEYWKMTPTFISRGWKTNLFMRCIHEPGRQYAVYLHHATLISSERYQAEPGNYSDAFSIDVPEGSYRAEWIDPQTLRLVREERIQHSGLLLALVSPEYRTDIALRITRD